MDPLGGLGGIVQHQMSSDKNAIDIAVRSAGGTPCFNDWTVVLHNTAIHVESGVSN